MGILFFIYTHFFRTQLGWKARALCIW